MKINEVIGLDIDKNMVFGKNVHALFNEIISNSTRPASQKSTPNAKEMDLPKLRYFWHK